MPPSPAATLPPAVEVHAVSRRFGDVTALRDVSLEVAAGEIHALLGVNGAGKTTLLRILSGLTEQSGGSAFVLGRSVRYSTELRELIGHVPSGDRTFQLRISGLENLIFFGRLHGMRKRVARERGLAALEALGLAQVAHRRVYTYSHGMQKRLACARALLADPPLLLMDESTHDLDPLAAQQVRTLVRERAAAGTATIWATQRVDELPGFADRVTVLDAGTVRYSGSVAALASLAPGARHVLRLAACSGPGLSVLSARLGEHGTLEELRSQEGRELGLALAPGVALGVAIARLVDAGAEIVSCRAAESELEGGFLALTAAPA